MDSKKLLVGVLLCTVIFSFTTQNALAVDNTLGDSTVGVSTGEEYRWDCTYALAGHTSSKVGDRMKLDVDSIAGSTEGLVSVLAMNITFWYWNDAAGGPYSLMGHFNHSQYFVYNSSVYYTNYTTATFEYGPMVFIIPKPLNHSNVLLSMNESMASSGGIDWTITGNTWNYNYTDPLSSGNINSTIEWNTDGIATSLNINYNGNGTLRETYILYETPTDDGDPPETPPTIPFGNEFLLITIAGIFVSVIYMNKKQK